MSATNSIVSALAITGVATVADSVIAKKELTPPVTVAIGLGVTGFALLLLAGPAPALATAFAWLIAVASLVQHGASLFTGVTNATTTPQH